MMKKFLLPIISGLLACSAANAAIELKPYKRNESSMEKNCYEIATADDLYEYASKINNAESISESGVCAYLKNDIVVNENVMENMAKPLSERPEFREWIPIGKESSGKDTYYHGTFYGAGHTISGLYAYSNKGDAGLIGYADGSDVVTVGIYDLGIRDSYIVGKYSGALIGRSRNVQVEIENCFADSGYVESANYAGGLVGKISHTQNVSITSSYSADSIYTYAGTAGGIAGSLDSIDNLSITESYTEGTVGRGQSDETLYKVGGIVGRMSGDSLLIANVYNKGFIDNSRTGAAGIVGTIDTVRVAKIANAYNVGKFDNYAMAVPFVGTVGKGSLVTDNLFNTNGLSDAETYYAESAFENGAVATLLHDYKVGDVDGSIWGQNVTGGETLPNFSGEVKGTASWTKSIMIFIPDGDKSDGWIRQNYLEGVERNMPVLSRDGYVFGGWCPIKDCSKGARTKIHEDDTGDTAFVARWLKVDVPSKNSDDCYEISSAGELYGFVDKVKADSSVCGVLTDDVVVNEGVLGSDGEPKSEGYFKWTPVLFAGKLDGDNHTISGLYFNNENVSSVGLFSNLYDKAEIQNLGIVDSYFNGYQNVGTFGGKSYTNNVKIHNSYSKSTVKGTYDVGGFVGFVQNRLSRDSLYITQSFNEGKVVAQEKKVGGFIGATYGIIAFITNSYNMGDVSATNVVGGFAGYVYGGSLKAENSFNVGKVSAEKDSVDAITPSVYSSYMYNVFYTGESNTDSSSKISVESEKNGALAWILHNYSNETSGVDGSIWGQDVAAGEAHPTFSGVVKGTGTVKKSIKFVTYTDDPEQGNYPTSYYFGVSLELPIIRRDGYVFGGWCSNEKCDDPAIKTLLSEDGGDTVLYARFLEVTRPKKNSDSCYVINNAGELYGFSKLVYYGENEACGVLANDIVVNENVLASEDSVNDDAFFEWMPIGISSSSGHFKGTFDGNGKKVSGLYTNRSYGITAGFIGYADSIVTVKNLTIEDSYFYSYSAAGIAVNGYARKLVVEGCVNRALVVGLYSAAGLTNGGVNVEIRQSVNEGRVIGPDAAGLAEGGISVTVVNSFNIGHVTGKKSNYTSAGRGAGLLCNVDTAYVFNNYNIGLVDGEVGVDVDVDDILVNVDSVSLGNVFFSGTSNVGVKKESAEFSDGTVAKLLRDYAGTITRTAEDGTEIKTSVKGDVWGQIVGVDAYPVFREGIGYPVAYHLNGGSFSSSAAEVYSAGEKFTLPTPKRTGYNFSGWYANEKFSGSAVKELAADATGAKDFYAKWAVKTYTVTFFVDSKQYGDAQTVEYGKDASKPKDPVKDGYKFLDWDVSFKNVKKDLNVNAKFEKVAATSSSSSSAKAKSSSSSTKNSVIPGSDPESGSSTKPRSSSSKKAGSSSSKKDAIAAHVAAPMFGVNVAGREIQVTGASVGEKCSLFDAQGRLMYASRVGNASFAVAVMQPGRYIMRIGSQTVTLNVK